ncbi:hypothetical protein [Nonomuraea ferruginea]|uniref:Uncharacterized protein n=1 Tax=Nonomuraea ferruginea TaxID=46174 RepID=A0ABT4SRF9_9ACTN|nr:hypothetical protein [Nonomuraea ferruginea]MDA0639485.1 hypothetical protein [Nonomuraea ferruginea]
MAGSTPAAGPSAPDSEPVSGRPENPEPSRPVIMPMTSRAKAMKKALDGIAPCAAFTSSNRKLGASAPSSRPRMRPAKSPLPMKKKPAIGSTMPIAFIENTRPSTTCSAHASRLPRASLVIEAASSRSATTPPTRAAASEPTVSGTRPVNLPSSM